MDKKVVGITGASGFIGQKLIERLETENLDVRAIDRKGELREQILGCDSVVHLASINNSSNPDIENANVKFTQTLINAMPKRCLLVFTSSFSVYKIPPKGDIISESYPIDPRNFYGQTKLKAENIIKESGLNAWILRLSNVYGPGMPPFKHSVVSTFTELIKEGKEITVDGDGSQTRDFLHIDDAVSAIICALEQKLVGVRIVNICSGVDTSLNTLVDKISQSIGRKTKVKYNLSADISTSGFWKGDNSLAKKLLNWTPSVFI